MWAEKEPFTGRIYDYDFTDANSIFAAAEEIKNTPTPEPTQEELLQKFTGRIESWLDMVVAERGYKSMERLVGYLNSTNPL
jgi:hypothetical protein